MKVPISVFLQFDVVVDVDVDVDVDADVDVEVDDAVDIGNTDVQQVGPGGHQHGDQLFPGRHRQCKTQGCFSKKF